MLLYLLRSLMEIRELAVVVNLWHPRWDIVTLVATLSSQQWQRAHPASTSCGAVTAGQCHDSLTAPRLPGSLPSLSWWSSSCLERFAHLSCSDWRECRFLLQACGSLSILRPSGGRSRLGLQDATVQLILWLGLGAMLCRMMVSSSPRLQRLSPCSLSERGCS